MDCHVGGLVSYRHNEVRDTIGDLSSLVWKQVQKEPIVRESTIDDSTSETLIADLRVCGVWEPRVDAIFDVGVVDTDAPSYCSRSPQAVLRSAEVERKGKYSLACQARHASFTPLCFSVDGLLGGEANFFLKCLADHLAARWEKSCSVVMGWVKARLSFALLCATMLCVRGSRERWRSLGVTGGAYTVCLKHCN